MRMIRGPQKVDSGSGTRNKAMRQDLDRKERDDYASVRRSVPFGYRVESAKESDACRVSRSTRPVPHPEQSAIVKLIFKRVIENGSSPEAKLAQLVGAVSESRRSDGGSSPEKYGSQAALPGAGLNVAF
jgi:hypothetical protein